MRLLFLLHSYSGSHGVGYFAKKLIESMEHEVVVIDRHFGAGYSFEKKGQNQYTVISPDSQNMLLRDHQYEDENTLTVLKNILAREKPFDIVHIHHLISWPNSVVDHFNFLGLPIVASVHDTWYICPALNYFNRFHGKACSSYLRERTHNNCNMCLQGLNEQRYSVTHPISWYQDHVISKRKGYLEVLNKVDAVVFPTQKMIDLYKKEGLVHSNIVKIPHFLEVQGEPSKKKEKETVFGYTGNISLGKGVEQLISAFSLVAGKMHLRIYGHLFDANLKETLDQYCEKDRRIQYLGPYRAEDSSRILSELDVVVVPSMWPESFNLCAYEAVQKSRHVLVSDVAFHSEFLSDKNCTVFDSKNSNDLQKRIRDLHTSAQLKTCTVPNAGVKKAYNDVYSDLVTNQIKIAATIIYVVENREQLERLKDAYLAMQDVCVLFDKTRVDLQEVWKSIPASNSRKISIQPLRSIYNVARSKQTDVIIALLREAISSKDILIAYKGDFTLLGKSSHSQDGMCLFKAGYVDEDIISEAWNKPASP